MTEELRLVLLFAGILIIGYIAWDAKRRKGQDPANLSKDNNQSVAASENNLSTEADEEHFDAFGYDDLGLTQAREIGSSTQNAQSHSQNKPPQTTQKSQTTPTNFQHQSVERVEPNLENEVDISVVDESTINETDSNSEKLHDASNIESLQKPETVITINLMSDSGAEFKGPNLLQELLTLGFKFGDMGVFHRYQHANGQGERWFSLANAINPGNFDLDAMDQFSSPGLTLFMLLPGPQKPQDAFENMLTAAEKLKSVLGGKLEDGSHCVLTQQRIQLYREEILNFQRQYLAKLNHSVEE